jgi:hypothetical protein
MKKKKALMTYVRNESLYLPLWLKHHSKYFSIEDIYVLDNDSCDGSIEKAIESNLILRENVHKITCETTFTSSWLSGVASDFQNKLLEKYEWTILAESDEFIGLDPNLVNDWDELFNHLTIADKKVVRALGYDVIHDMKNEPPIDLNKPILSQRNKARLWRPELNNGKMLFSKPILSRVPVRWRGGGHDLADLSRVDIEERLVLFHLNMFDYELCTQRRKDRVAPGQIQINGDRLWVGQELINEINSYLTHKATVQIPERYQRLF